MQFLKARQTKYAAYAATYTAVILAILATVNVLANRYDKSFDATSNKRYSLSEQTVKIVKGDHHVFRRAPRIPTCQGSTRSLLQSVSQSSR